jgi:hypothetical protein
MHLLLNWCKHAMAYYMDIYLKEQIGTMEFFLSQNLREESRIEENQLFQERTFYVGIG